MTLIVHYLVVAESEADTSGCQAALEKGISGLKLRWRGMVEGGLTPEPLEAVRSADAADARPRRAKMN